MAFGLHRLSAVVLLPLLLASSGCAINALRVDYAKEVGAAGRAATAAGRAFVLRAREARIDANIELIAADPNCAVAPVVLRKALLLGPNTRARGSFCKFEAEKNPADPKLDLVMPVDEVRLTLDGVRALASYTDALASIAGAPAEDRTKTLLDALETARAIDQALGALIGSAPVGVPAADDKRVKAVKGFIAFISELRDEAERVEALRAVFAKNPDGAKPLIDALRDMTANWETSRKTDRALITSLMAAHARNITDRDPPTAPELRREAWQRYFASAEANATEARLKPALDVLLAELESADADFRRIIVRDPTLTSDERKKLAEITRQRIVRALNIFTSLVTSFG